MFKTIICICLVLTTLNLVDSKKSYLKAKAHNLKKHETASCSSGTPYILETSDGSGNYLGLSQSMEYMNLGVGNKETLYPGTNVWCVNFVNAIGTPGLIVNAFNGNGKNYYLAHPSNGNGGYNVIAEDFSLVNNMDYEWTVQSLGIPGAKLVQILLKLDNTKALGYVNGQAVIEESNVPNGSAEWLEVSP